MLRLRHPSHTASPLLSIAHVGAMVFGLSLLGGCPPSYPNCDGDGDCQDGEFCVDNTCQQCRSDSDCQEGQRCASGRCEAIEGYCADDSACPDGQECRNNRCATIQTVDNTPPPQDNTAGPCSLEPVYFEFDSHDLDRSSRDIISANASCVRDRSISSVHITGYTDPRGTEEYNLALGDRRAQSVRRYMVQLGVPDGAVTASSVGEEMSSGTNESGWRRDRKVTFTER